MAAPGYGKRSAPDQAARDRQTFAHLPEREAHIAAHIDRLPDGAAIDVKTLAKELAAYGQQAIRTALTALTAAGHVFRKRETVGKGRTQWVWRSYFSRTPRSEAWWKRFLKGDTAGGEPQAAEEEPRRSEAYEALAVVGRTDPRLPLSAAECADLEPLAAEWLARGITRSQLVRALTANLPGHIHAPAAFTRSRLLTKCPPELPPPAQQHASPTPTLSECAGCGTPGRPEALPDGLCHPCHGAPTEPPELPEPSPVPTRAAAAARAAHQAGRARFLARPKRAAQANSSPSSSGPRAIGAGR
ncbi:hypothetical protein [Streptomyces griseocarneus]|uniref:MarR family transcriptional regulator n=1 Tax=Streptomyces griseocarneus TaxID=51201 RepID=A0ABX7RU06_9ACTN|nr:hypothetical protein [Streptomyces griseocarneus]QSY51782.1 hypothetical protein J3S04_13530 [Streptomyces griseocarneus]